MQKKWSRGMHSTLPRVEPVDQPLLPEPPPGRPPGTPLPGRGPGPAGRVWGVAGRTGWGAGLGTGWGAGLGAGPGAGRWTVAGRTG